MKVNRFLILLLLAQFGFAQTTAKLGPVAKDGLHRIFIPSGIRSFSTANLTDFRIYDKSGNEVPYQFSVSGNDTHYRFKSFRIISKTAVPKKTTSIVVENPSKKINAITLHIANAEVTKKFSISGSDDQQQWFGLANSRELSDIENARSSSEYKTITFPLSSYHYLRIDIDDKKTLPLNVLEAGSFDVERPELQKIEMLKPTKITTTQFKDKKQTLLQVDFANKQWLDRIAFKISAPNFYKRQVRIYKNVTYKHRKRTETREETLQMFELDSDNKTSYPVSIYAKEIFIEIDNRDNPPLQFSQMVFSQRVLSVIADLKANENYTVSTENEKLALPEYDFPNSWNESLDSLPEAKIVDIKHASMSVAAVFQKSFWQQAWFMWVCIGLGGLAILYFTVSLVRDVK